MTQQHSYALFAWGNYLHESELDRLEDWLAPEVRSGERIFEHPNLTLMDEEELRIDASRSYYAVDGEYVLGRDVADPGPDWRIAYLYLVTDGTAEDAERMMERLEAEADVDRDDAPDRTPVPVGEAVTVWADEHGQWDLALVRL